MNNHRRDLLALVASPLVPDRAARRVLWNWHKRGRRGAKRAKYGSGHDRRLGNDS